MMSKSLEKESKNYSEAGDSAKAEQLAKQAEAARNAAADKSNEAMGDVNQCYRETMPLSSSQMSQLPPEQQASYSQMREDITQKKTKMILQTINIAFGKTKKLWKYLQL